MASPRPKTILASSGKNIFGPSSARNTFGPPVAKNIFDHSLAQLGLRSYGWTWSNLFIWWVPNFWTIRDQAKRMNGVTHAPSKFFKIKAFLEDHLWNHRDAIHKEFHHFVFDVKSYLAKKKCLQSPKVKIFAKVWQSI